MKTEKLLVKHQKLSKRLNKLERKDSPSDEKRRWRLHTILGLIFGSLLCGLLFNTGMLTILAATIGLSTGLGTMAACYVCEDNLKSIITSRLMRKIYKIETQLLEEGVEFDHYISRIEREVEERKQKALREEAKEREIFEHDAFIWRTFMADSNVEAKLRYLDTYAHCYPTRRRFVEEEKASLIKRMINPNTKTGDLTVDDNDGDNITV